ncbi:hypothetical protein M1116_03640 [Patescibacteria group bacterium]|nr:hypothetical protein [Patescibacteria group bacterium]
MEPAEQAHLIASLELYLGIAIAVIIVLAFLLYRRRHVASNPSTSSQPWDPAPAPAEPEPNIHLGENFYTHVDQLIIKELRANLQVIVEPERTDNVAVSIEGPKSAVEALKLNQNGGQLTVSSPVPNLRDISIHAGISISDLRVSIGRGYFTRLPDITIRLSPNVKLSLSQTEGTANIGDLGNEVRINWESDDPLVLGNITHLKLTTESDGSVQVGQVSSFFALESNGNGDVTVVSLDTPHTPVEITLNDDGSFNVGHIAADSLKVTLNSNGSCHTDSVETPAGVVYVAINDDGNCELGDVRCLSFGYNCQGDGNLTTKSITGAEGIELVLADDGNFQSGLIAGGYLTIDSSAYGEINIESVSVSGFITVSVNEISCDLGTVACESFSLVSEGDGDINLQSLTANGNVNITLKDDANCRLGSLTAGSVKFASIGDGDLFATSISTRIGEVHMTLSDDGGATVGSVISSALRLILTGDGAASFDSLNCHVLNFEVNDDGGVKIIKTTAYTVDIKMNGYGDIDLGSGEVANDLRVANDADANFNFDGTAQNAHLTTQSGGSIFVHQVTNTPLMRRRGDGEITVANWS